MQNIRLGDNDVALIIRSNNTYEAIIKKSDDDADASDNSVIIAALAIKLSDKNTDFRQEVLDSIQNEIDDEDELDRTLDAMSKKELDKLAQDRYGVNIPNHFKKQTMIERIKELEAKRDQGD